MSQAGPRNPKKILPEISETWQDIVDLLYKFGGLDPDFSKLVYELSEGIPRDVVPWLRDRVLIDIRDRRLWRDIPGQSPVAVDILTDIMKSPLSQKRR